jgi:2-polyprenyl-6-hydroxyphenyl methylase / 3-demethylubiquinone-9 3-methyltransferase
MHTVDAKEIEIFAKDSSNWWDEDGPFRPLHRLNPVRLSYFKDRICEQYDLDTKSLRPYTGLSILDIGCGGGLVCEPMARLGANVTGIDADANAIAVAQNHAKQSGLDIDYRAVSTDGLIQSSKKHDVVLALEIVEHVADVSKFVEHALSLCKSGGIVIFSTLNRTPKSFLLGKIAAEYILGWVPKGTHDWKKFLKPSELGSAIRQAGGEPTNIEGLVFDPIKGGFKRSARDVDVNYFITLKKA